jgi:hypothetical protein
MALWTLVTSSCYARESKRWGWLVVVDVLLTCALMLTSRFVLSAEQYADADPLITTVWAAVPPAVAGARFGRDGGILAGLVVAVGTGLAQWSRTTCSRRSGSSNSTTASNWRATPSSTV